MHPGNLTSLECTIVDTKFSQERQMKFDWWLHYISSRFTYLFFYRRVCYP